MANVELKKDFKDGQFLYGDDLNNNFKVIEAGINANEKNLQNVIDQAQEDLKDELEEITGERGWDWNDNSGERVTFYKGDTNQVNEKAISNGQLLYDIITGETALDTGGKRVKTGAGNILAVSDEEPTNPGTKVWIKPNELQKVDSTEVIDSLEGNETNLAPSVRAVKGSFMQILPENYNVDNVKTSGIYGILNAKGTLPAGLDINDNNIFLHCFMWFKHYGRQIIYDVRTLKTYMRILNNDIWFEWKSENNDYTTEEQVIGTWMGKPLYRKVFTGNISKDTILISNVATLVDVKGTGEVSGLYRVIPFYQIYNDKEYSLTIEKKDTNEVVLIVNESGESSVSYNSNIILEYTKTTD